MLHGKDVTLSHWWRNPNSVIVLMSLVRQRLLDLFAHFIPFWDLRQTSTVPSNWKNVFLVQRRTRLNILLMLQIAFLTLKSIQMMSICSYKIHFDTSLAAGPQPMKKVSLVPFCLSGDVVWNRTDGHMMQLRKQDWKLARCHWERLNFHDSKANGIYLFRSILCWENQCMSLVISK